MTKINTNNFNLIVAKTLVDTKDNIKTRGALAEKDKENSKELKKLQFYGPGPKMAGFNTKEPKQKSNKTRGVKLVYDFDPVCKLIKFKIFLSR